MSAPSGSGAVGTSVMRAGRLGRLSPIEQRVELPAVASSAAGARAHARSALAAWGLGHFDETVSLLVTELISNGVRHARTRLTLALAYDGTCLRIAVSDGDPRPPVPRAPERLTVGGWGLALVDSLATNWGADIDELDGKTVWFEIDTTETVSRFPAPTPEG